MLGTTLEDKKVILLEIHVNFRTELNHTNPNYIICFNSIKDSITGNTLV